MLNKILFISLYFVVQFSFAQTNLLSYGKQDVVYDTKTKNLKSRSSIMKVLYTFSFIFEEPASITISDVNSSTPFFSKYNVISTEEDKVNDLINFTVRDEKNIEYLLMLSIKKNQIVIVYEENTETFVTSYFLASRKN